LKVERFVVFLALSKITRNKSFLQLLRLHSTSKLSKNLDSVQGSNLREPRFVTPTTAEFVRQAEIIKAMKEVESIRQDLGLTSNRARQKNVGFANIEVDGQQTRVIANSGEVSKEGTSPKPERRFFKTIKDGYGRAFDSEVKILEEFAAKYENRGNIKGNIYLFTERPPCESCTKVVEQFREMFPNVRIEIASGNYIEKKGNK